MLFVFRVLNFDAYAVREVNLPVLLYYLFKTYQLNKQCLRIHFNFTLIQFANDIDEYLRRCASLWCRSILRLAPLSSGGHSINVAPFVIYFDVIVPATRVYKYCFHILNTFVLNVIDEPVSIVFVC